MDEAARAEAGAVDGAASDSGGSEPSSPLALHMHPPVTAATPHPIGAVSYPRLYVYVFVKAAHQPCMPYVQECRSELLAGSIVPMTGCLANLLTLSAPVEVRVRHFSEHFSHALAEVKSRMALLLGRTDEMGQQTAALRQRQDGMEANATDLERQQSNLSDQLVAHMSDTERQQEGLEQQTMDLELRTALLEQQTDLNQEEQTDLNQSLTSEMKKLTQQMQEVEDRVMQAEDGVAKTKTKFDDVQQQVENSKNRGLSQEDRDSLLHRMVSMEERLKRFEARLPFAKVLSETVPRRSFSHPF